MSVPQPFAIFHVGSVETLVKNIQIFDGSPSTDRILKNIGSDDYRATLVTASAARTMSAADTLAAGVVFMAEVLAVDGSGELYIDRVLKASDGAYGAGVIAGQFSIGAYINGSAASSITMQECLIYGVDISSQREIIECNIAWGYSK